MQHLRVGLGTLLCWHTYDMWCLSLHHPMGLPAQTSHFLEGPTEVSVSGLGPYRTVQLIALQ